MILGTAGHVDHGKTALVKALTGVDTDRLEEEKRRGITIDLGFAPLRLADDLTLGVVDVPGHEAFVRNMVAGATGIDLALLVIAADEGIMPQTREHLHILRLLGVRAGVVALSKCDLVDAEWLELVQEDVRAALADTPLAGAPVVPTSVVSGEGIAELRAAIRSAADALPARDSDDVFRMPIDRAFSLKGTGTVVTGTVWSGTLRRDAAGQVMPMGRTVRVRGLESHGASIAAATTGMRAAVALAGVEVADLRRGQVLVADASWTPTTVLLARVEMLRTARQALGPRTQLRFHLGTADVGARVVALGGAVRPGATAAARVVLDEPVVARAGDRFVLRGESPLVTVGGGVVDDPLPQGRRSRPWSRAASSVAERLDRHLTEAGARGVAVGSLPVRLGASPAQAEALARGDGSLGARRLGDRLYSERAVQDVRAALLRLIDEHHAAAPLEPGAPLQAIRSRLGAAPELIETIVRDAIAAGAVQLDGGLIARKGWAPALTERQARLQAELLAALERAGAEPPSVGELEATHGPDVVPLLRLLERRQLVVPVEIDRWFARSALDGLIGRLRGGMEPRREHTPSELRDMLGISRKFLIPVLEYCDRHQITERRSSGRVLIGP
ncbi:MAG TPA: selenocysteine-specific translation elongation factor [Gemmatimonadaceae bacterium]|nr:selenocysteine-specific translation elongation factor [Gemmatimonadaceae bacterium]